jgi:hypothetical protein
MITIHPKTKITQLQEEFHRRFPFLKLEFFKHAHQVHEGNAKRDLMSPADSAKVLSTQKENENLLISEDMTVTELEQLLSHYFGLSAQVFRKSGRSWLETTVTDDWTLRRQNDQGNELSRLHRG